jgi:hypothetical protein
VLLHMTACHEPFAAVMAPVIALAASAALILASVASQPSQQCSWHEIERAALMDLFVSTSGATWGNSSGWGSAAVRDAARQAVRRVQQGVGVVILRYAFSIARRPIVCGTASNATPKVACSFCECQPIVHPFNALIGASDAVTFRRTISRVRFLQPSGT